LPEHAVFNEVDLGSFCHDVSLQHLEALAWGDVDGGRAGA
jgi:hypothetical protein